MNRIRHILNVTREIDNFFPGMFNYFNVRVYDDEKTNLLKHWDNTFRYITRAKAEGSKVLVHCKMGVSRSASVVIAYAMKAYNWEFQQALQHVKGRRSCIKPNKNFLNQLETYRGMLDAMKNKEKLQRSKSETNLKSNKDARLLPGSEPTPLIQALNQSKSKSAGYEISSGDGSDSMVTENDINKLGACKGTVVGGDIGGGDANLIRQRRIIRRSSSSSPKTIQSQSAGISQMIVAKQQSQSLENLTPERSVADEPKNMRFPGSNGENYSVTQNQVLHIQKNTPPALAARFKTPHSVKTIIHDLEMHHGVERKVFKVPFSRSISHDTSGYINKEQLHTNPTWTSTAGLIAESGKTETTKLPIQATEQPKSEEKDKKQSFHRKTQSWFMNPASSNHPNINSSCTTTTPCNYEFSNKNHTLRDSGLIMRHRTSELPSRHASWGSGDQRCAFIPRMRNSSWSAYDTNCNNNNIQTHNTTAAIYEDQIQSGVDTNNAELITMSYKTAPIPFFEATMNNSTNTKNPTTGSSVKRTKQILEKHNCSSKSSIQSSVNSKHYQQQQQRRKHLFRSSSAAGTTTPEHAADRVYPSCHSSQDILDSQNIANNKTVYDHKDLSDLQYTMSDIANKNMSTLQNIIIDSMRADEVILRDSVSNCTFNEQRISSGNVKVLKKNFEARANTITTGTAYPTVTASTESSNTVTITVGETSNINTMTTVNMPKKPHQSLPSSPVAQHVDFKIVPAARYEKTKDELDIITTVISAAPLSNSKSEADASVKGLVHKYQSTASSTSTITSMLNSNTTSTAMTNFKPRPRSYYDILLHKNADNIALCCANPLRHEYNENRPPPAPIKERVEQLQPQPKQSLQLQGQQHQSSSGGNTALTILSHKRLRQHGKTHPLSRLSLPKENFNAAAYNTM